MAMVARAGVGHSVHSRLIGEKVEARLGAGFVEVWYAGRKVEDLARLRGRGKHRVDPVRADLQSDKVTFRWPVEWDQRSEGCLCRGNPSDVREAADYKVRRRADYSQEYFAR
jgi:hypothetical protein